MQRRARRDVHVSRTRERSDRGTTDNASARTARNRLLDVEFLRVELDLALRVLDLRHEHLEELGTRPRRPIDLDGTVQIHELSDDTRDEGELNRAVGLWRELMQPPPPA